MILVARGNAARPIAVQRLDLDYVRAVLGHQHAGIGSSDALTEIDNLETLVRRIVTHIRVPIFDSVDRPPAMGILVCSYRAAGGMMGRLDRGG